jgi:hypothetical protein
LGVWVEGGALLLDLAFLVFQRSFRPRPSQILQVCESVGFRSTRLQYRVHELGSGLSRLGPAGSGVWRRRLLWKVVRV